MNFRAEITGHWKAFIVIVIISVSMTSCLLSPSLAFDIPEKLNYDLSWIGIKAGESSLEISDGEDGTIHIASTARSVGWVSVLFRVRDRVDAVIEKEPFWFPINYHLQQEEGARERNWEVVFDRKELKATYIDHLNDEKKEYEVPPKVFDPLSAFFMMRKADLVIGESSYITLFDSELLYELEVKVIKKEKIVVPAGEFDTILISPILQSEGIFSREGAIYTWLTDDEKRIPVKLKTKVSIGSISAELVSVENSDSPVKKDDR
ncbi:MAG: DUF3108 domain-containing protein [Nitrospirota bacterium]|nr:MAG: DUF3108 domain-containing protein [Nitrospirota bacterium]